MEYVVKKKLMSGERVHYKCPSCAGELESPLNDAGKPDTCPLCGKAFVVPGQRELENRRTEELNSQAQAQRQTKTRAKEMQHKRVESIRAKAERALAQDMASQGVPYEDKLTFEGAWTPQVALLDGERVVDVFEAGLWDLGLLGWLFGYKRRLVLTTHRLFRFDKRIVDNRLDVLWLPKVKSVMVGQVLHGIMVILGIVLLLSVIPVVRIFPLSAGPTRVITALSLLGLAVLLFVFSRRKVMTVSTGEDKAGIMLTRLKSEESGRLVNKLFVILQNTTPK